MENHIFFLKYTTQLPMEFFQFSKMFSKWGIKLVPARPEDLAELMNSQKVFAISLDNKMTVHKYVLAHRKQFLEYALLNRRLVLFDIGSFGKMLSAYQAERAKCYFHFALPVTIDQVVKEITAAYYRDKRDVQTWPGGRRAKLPTG